MDQVGQPEPVGCPAEGAVMVVHDPASAVVDVVSRAMREAFDAGSSFPPLGGGSTDVRLLAGDAIPLAMWNAHADEGCDEPFLWVRLARRYRTDEFPAATTDPAPCRFPVGLQIEVGVGRCAVVDMEPSWDDYAREAEVSLDDSWRIELALCRAAGLVESSEHGVDAAIGEVVPFGPEGGVIAWSGELYVRV